MWELGSADDHGNVISGDVETLDVTDSYLRGSGRLIAAVGLDNVTVVDTPDATLIASRDRVQDVKAMVDRLAEQGRREVETDGSETRDWGGFATLHAEPGLAVVRLWLEPGAKTSLQTHTDQSEYWIVIAGAARITSGDTSRHVPEEDAVFVPAGELHRLENASDDAMLEVIGIHIAT